MNRFLLLLTSSFLISSQLSHACTGLKLTARDGSVIHGRTAEFDVELDLSIIVIPRGYRATGTTSLGKGLEYQSKYAVIGATAFGSDAIIDGMNEKGLCAGVFYFSQFANYTPTTPENQACSLSPTEFSNWILSQFATLEEVRSHLSNIYISPTILAGWGPVPPPFHYVIYDKKGASIVIEPIKGKLIVHENPLGTIANSPTFDWHMTNLNNYVHLSPFQAEPVIFGGLTFTPFSSGAGMIGLPGDYSSPSRFVRASVFSVAAPTPDNAQDAVLDTFHMLNAFDIPFGVVRTDIQGTVYTSSTLATSVKDPQALKYYFKTYEDQTLKVIDLSKFDLNAKNIKKMKLSDNQTYVDVTHLLK